MLTLTAPVVVVTDTDIVAIVAEVEAKPGLGWPGDTGDTDYAAARFDRLLAALIGDERPTLFEEESIENDNEFNRWGGA